MRFKKLKGDEYMTLYDSLMERKKKAETMKSIFQSNFVALDAYMKICKQIFILEQLKMLLEVAPQSMDPRKQREHLTRVVSVLKEADTQGIEATAAKFIESLPITTVTSYADGIRLFVSQNLKLPTITT